MENLIFTQLSIPEVRQIFRQELEHYFETHKQARPGQSEQEQPLNLQESADFLKITPRTVARHAREGEIKHSKKAGKLYFFKKDLTEWVKGGRKKTNAEISAEANTYIQSKKKKAPNERV